MWPTDPNEFESTVARPESVDAAHYFIFCDGAVLTAGGDSGWRPVNRDEFRWLDIDVHAEHYLGMFRGQHCFAVEASIKGRAPDGHALVDLRVLLGRVEPSLFYVAGRAKQIVEWHKEHRFCGRCGVAMRDHAADRAKECPDCGLISYPRLSPSIIVLVRRGEQCLLARNARWPQGMYSTLAGFVEPGESVEQTVHREVMEEVGIRVTNLRYLGSQSWPFPNSLMLGFHADYAGGEIVCQEGEISDARFFAFDQLPNVPGSIAISGWLIDGFVQEMQARQAD